MPREGKVSWPTLVIIYSLLRVGPVSEFYMAAWRPVLIILLFFGRLPVASTSLTRLVSIVLIPSLVFSSN